MEVCMSYGVRFSKIADKVFETRISYVSSIPQQLYLWRVTTYMTDGYDYIMHQLNRCMKFWSYKHLHFNLQSPQSF